MKKKIKKHNKDMLANAIIASEEGPISLPFTKNINKRILSILHNKKVFISGGILVTATFLTNILNYIFNAFLGRVLSFNDFSLIGLMGGFYSFASLFFGAYSLTVNYRSSFLIGKYGDAAGYRFWKHVRKHVIYPSIILSVIWLLLIPFLMNFFHTNNIYLFIFFSFVLLVGFLNNVNIGFLSSKMMFGSLAILSLIDPIVKLTTTFFLVSIGLSIWTFSAIPLAIFVAFITGWFLLFKQVPSQKTTAPLTQVQSYSKKFLVVSLLTGFSTVAYFTFDIFLAKHFLSSTQAGEYVLVSLVGRMIFFLGNLPAPFITPFVSRYEGANKNSLHALYILIVSTAVLSFIGFILFGVFGYLTVPLLYGEKARIIVPYVLFFTFGMACYTVSSIFVNYYLVRRIYTFAITSALLVLIQVALLSIFHDSVKTIAIVMSVVLIINLIVSTALHLKAQFVEKFEKSSLQSFGSLLTRHHNLSFVYNKRK